MRSINVGGGLIKAKPIFRQLNMFIDFWKLNTGKKPGQLTLRCRDFDTLAERTEKALEKEGRKLPKAFRLSYRGVKLCKHHA